MTLTLTLGKGNSYCKYIKGNHGNRTVHGNVTDLLVGLILAEAVDHEAVDVVLQVLGGLGPPPVPRLEQRHGSRLRGGGRGVMQRSACRETEHGGRRTLYYYRSDWRIWNVRKVSRAGVERPISDTDAVIYHR